jgi:hypothetical protein
VNRSSGEAGKLSSLPEEITVLEKNGNILLQSQQEVIRLRNSMETSCFRANNMGTSCLRNNMHTFCLEKCCEGNLSKE